MTVQWPPTLADVAAVIPTRTVDQTTPGSEEYLNNFTTATNPTGFQAQIIIDSAVQDVRNAVASIPTALEPAAANAAKWRAAADIELAYPDRDADIHVYEQLNARAQIAWDQFLSQAASVGGSETSLIPVWYMPDPVAWGDTDL